MQLVYKLFENPRNALLGFSEDWVMDQLGIPKEKAVEMIKTLRILNIVKMGPTGLSFIINTSL